MRAETKCTWERTQHSLKSYNVASQPLQESHRVDISTEKSSDATEVRASLKDGAPSEALQKVRARVNINVTLNGSLLRPRSR